MPASIRNRPPIRRFLLSAFVAMGLAVQMVVTSRGVSEAATEAPATMYSSITSCEVEFSESDLDESDSFTVTGTFGGSGWMRIGADGLGPALASVLVDSGVVSGLATGAVADIRAVLSMATGAHTMDFYAVDATGAATGDPLCRVDYTLTGPTPFPGFTGPTQLPRGVRGAVYDTDNHGEPGSGAFTYTPTVTETSYAVQRCELVGATHDGGAGGNGGNGGVGGNGGNGGAGGAGSDWDLGGTGGNGGAGGLLGGTGGNGGAGGNGGNGGNGGSGGLLGGTGGAGGIGGDGGNGGSAGWFGGSYGGGIQLGVSPDGRSTSLADSGLHFTPGEVAGVTGPAGCGRLWGTPMVAGTFTVTLRVLYRLSPSVDVGTTPASDPEGVDEQTFASYQTYTLVIEAPPTFTG